MDFNDRDLAGLKRDIERVQKHEDTRRAKQFADEPAPLDPPAPDATAPASFSILRWLRGTLDTLLFPPDPSLASGEGIPEHLVTLLLVIRERPRLKRWLLSMERLPLVTRNELLKKIVVDFRKEDAASAIADSFGLLQDSKVFQAFCRTLRDSTGP